MRRVLKAFVLRIALVLAPVGAALYPAQTAQAQFGMGGGMNIDPITKRGVLEYARLADLDEGQKTTALTLLEGYQQQSRALRNALQEEMQGGGFMSDPKGMQEKLKDFQKKYEDAEKQFFDDLKLLLNPEQLEKWPKVERFRRREKLLRMGMVSGAGVDLVRVTQSSKAAPADSAEFAEIVERYETDMDKALVTFEASARKEQEDMMSGENMMDFKKIQTMMQKLTDDSRKIRDLNKDAFRKLLPLAPEDRRAAFEEEFNRRSFPMIYRQRAGSKLIEAAMKFEDLEPAQRESIAALKDSYTKDLNTANTRLAEVTERAEEENGGTWGMMMGPMMGGAEPEDLKEAKAARDAVDQTTREKLMSILTEPQRTKLPEVKSDKDNPMAAMQEMMKEMEAESTEQ
ncbi:MAG: hypothetical protein ACOYN0_02165 [Phycisphaerales bacterium]